MTNAFTIPTITAVNNTFQLSDIKTQIIKILDKYYEKVDKQKKLRYEFFKLNANKLNEINSIKNQLHLLYKEVLGLEQEYHRLVSLHITNYRDLL